MCIILIHEAVLYIQKSKEVETMKLGNLATLDA